MSSLNGKVRGINIFEYNHNLVIREVKCKECGVIFTNSRKRGQKCAKCCGNYTIIGGGK